jgi:hypothetical protein
VGGDAGCGTHDASRVGLGRLQAGSLFLDFTDRVPVDAVFENNDGMAVISLALGIAVKKRAVGRKTSRFDVEEIDGTFITHAFSQFRSRHMRVIPVTAPFSMGTTPTGHQDREYPVPTG